MTYFIIALFVVIAWEEVIAPLIVFLAEGAFYVLGVLAECLWLATKAALRGLWRGVLWFARRAGDGALLLFFLAAELLRGSPEDEQEDEETPDAGEGDDEGAEADAPDTYAAALVVLSLPERCSQKELTKAYRRAIGIAHPDKGGTAAQAQAVNAACEVIARRNGWN